LQAAEKVALARRFALRLACDELRLPGGEAMAELCEPVAEQNERRAAQFGASAELGALRARLNGRGASGNWWMARLFGGSEPLQRCVALLSVLLALGLGLVSFGRG